MASKTPPQRCQLVMKLPKRLIGAATLYGNAKPLAKVDFFFFEYQGNRYYRTYVELHSKMCDFVDTSTLFGDTLKKAVGNKGCPFSPGPHLYPNLTIPIKSIPNSFPYRQGRLFCNTSITHRGTTSRLAEATIDLEVKDASRNKITNKASLIN